MPVSTEPKPQPIAVLLARVAADVGAVGKDSFNEQQRFNFRSIDAIVGEVHKHLIAHGVSILPEYSIVDRYDRTTKAGALNEFVIVEGTFRFVGPAGDSLEVRTIGQGSDLADKAASKAMTAAFKTMLLQTFTIPTTGSDDPDFTGEESVVLPPVNVDDALARIAAADEATAHRMAEALPAMVTAGRLSPENADRLALAIESRLDTLTTDPAGGYS